jgi:hypothetical protein
VIPHVNASMCEYSRAIPHLVDITVTVVGYEIEASSGLRPVWNSNEYTLNQAIPNAGIEQLLSNADLQVS